VKSTTPPSPPCPPLFPFFPLEVGYVNLVMQFHKDSPEQCAPFSPKQNTKPSKTPKIIPSTFPSVLRTLCPPTFPPLRIDVFFFQQLSPPLCRLVLYAAFGPRLFPVNTPHLPTTWIHIYAQTPRAHPYSPFSPHLRSSFLPPPPFPPPSTSSRAFFWLFEMKSFVPPRTPSSYWPPIVFSHVDP